MRERERKEENYSKLANECLKVLNALPRDRCFDPCPLGLGASSMATVGNTMEVERDRAGSTFQCAPCESEHFGTSCAWMRSVYLHFSDLTRMASLMGSHPSPDCPIGRVCSITSGAWDHSLDIVEASLLHPRLVFI